MPHDEQLLNSFVEFISQPRFFGMEFIVALDYHGTFKIHKYLYIIVKYKN